MNHNLWILALHKLVGQAASRAGGIERVTPDGARLIGLALEEYVKNLVSKAIHAASHRNIQFKDNEHREKVNDVKTQFKLLQGMFRMILEIFVNMVPDGCRL